MIVKNLLTAAVALGGLLLGDMPAQAQTLQAEPGAARNLKLVEDRYTGNFCTDGEAYCLRMIGPNSVSYKSASGLSGQLSGLPVRPGETALPAPQLMELDKDRLLIGVEFASNHEISNGRMQRRDTVYWDVDLRDGSVLGPILEFTAHISIDTYDCRNWPQDKQVNNCHARYIFNSIVDAIGARRDGYPALTYRTAATIEPHGASREYGWTTPTSYGSDGKELHLGCTFRRSYIYHPISARYVLDQPLPDCDQFLNAEMLPRRSRDKISELQMRPATAAEVQNYARFAYELGSVQSGRTVEIGWLYNEMVSGSDIVVLRTSTDGRCEEGSDCGLYFFATANCVEPALCTPKWSQNISGNRIYTVQNPHSPLSTACPEALFVVPAGPEAGQYCTGFNGLEPKGPLPNALAARLSPN